MRERLQNSEPFLWWSLIFVPNLHAKACESRGQLADKRFLVFDSVGNEGVHGERFYLLLPIHYLVANRGWF